MAVSALVVGRGASEVATGSSDGVRIVFVFLVLAAGCIGSVLMFGLAPPKAPSAHDALRRLAPWVVVGVNILANIAPSYIAALVAVASIGIMGVVEWRECRERLEAR